MPSKAPIRADKVYARVTGGSRQYWCPDCGHFNNVKAPVWQVLIRVCCSYCRAHFFWGTVFYRPELGVLDVPPDVVSPQFADVYPTKRGKGEPVNRLRTLHLDGTWEES